MFSPRPLFPSRILWVVQDATGIDKEELHENPGTMEQAGVGAQLGDTCALEFTFPSEMKRSTELQRFPPKSANLWLF